MEPALPEQTIDPAARELLGRLGNGAVLLAREELQDPNFITTVVLVCIYSKEGGTYGLVLNRPSHMPLSEIFDGFSDFEDKREVYIGGPVQQDELQILQITDTPQTESHQIGPRVHLGGKWESVEQMLGQDPSCARLFLGYSGWAAGQLEAEIEVGAWDVFRVDLETLLLNTEKTLAPDVRSIAEYLASIAAEQD